jgi:hypothetical protein|nr:MAG TPA: hypothetical protein [Caudoviricetes sp.]
MNKTITPNAIKIEVNQESFKISFAVTGNSDSITDEVDVMIDPRNMLSVITPMVSAVVDYQKQFGVDLGIKTPDSNQTEV